MNSVMVFGLKCKQQEYNKKLLLSISNEVPHKQIVKRFYILIPEVWILFGSSMLLKRSHEQIVLPIKRPENLDSGFQVYQSFFLLNNLHKGFQEGL